MQERVTLGTMQDRFVGDIGDFGKYGLLRALTGIYPEAEPRLSLGVVWWVPDPVTVANTKSTHGAKVHYLTKPQQYRGCDPDLFEQLGEVTLRPHDRNLEQIETSRILGDRDQMAVTYYGESIPRGWPARRRWLEKALANSATQCLVFLDPDTGLAPRGKANTDSPSHVYPQEIRPFLEREQTVVVYQHHAYQPQQVEGQRRNWARALRSLSVSRVRILTYEDRDFLILPSMSDAETIDTRVNRLLEGPWGRYLQQHPLS